jgi:polysaccharide export outer membrane protein
MDASVLKAPVLKASVERPNARAVARLAVRAAALAWLASMLAACESDGASPTLVATASPAMQAGAATNAVDYRIAPQDEIEISVFQVPSLNRTVQVDGNGIIDLPLIGAIKVGGSSPRDVEAQITKRLGAKYVQSPQVTVVVKDGLAMRFSVDGSVMKPGVYVAKGETTLTQAIALAGGLSEVGDTDNIVIARVVDGQRTTNVHSLKAIRAGRSVDPPVYGKDTVYIADSATLDTVKFVRDLGGTAISAARLIP